MAQFGQPHQDDHEAGNVMVALRIGDTLLRTFPGLPICRGMTAIAMAADMRRITVQHWLILTPGSDENQQHE